MPDYTDDFDSEDAGLIDQKAIADILDKAQDALRPLGLTMNPGEVAISIQNGQTVALIPCLIRPSAKKKLVQDQETREQFNQMMAKDNDARIASEAEKIKALAADPDALAAFLYGDDDDATKCQHDTIHEGLCLDCNEEVS